MPNSLLSLSSAVQKTSAFSSIMADIALLHMKVTKRFFLMANSRSSRCSNL